MCVPYGFDVSLLENGLNPQGAYTVVELVEKCENVEELFIGGIYIHALSSFHFIFFPQE
jgi:hypothetical protein